VRFLKGEFNLRRHICFSLTVILLVVLVGCNAEKQPRHIGFAVMGSKEVYDYDSSFLNGVQMAVEECNAVYGDEGFVVDCEFFDDGYNFEQGLIISDTIANDPQYTAVLGSHSFSILDATVSLFEENNKILIAVNSMMDKSIVGKGYQNIFRNTAGEADFAKSLAVYAEKHGLKRMAVMYSETEFEMNVVKNFSREAQSLGIPVLSYVTEVGLERSFQQTADTWTALGIDGVFICRDAINDAFTLAKYVRSASDSIRILGDFSFDASDKLTEYEQYIQGIVIPVLVPVTQSEKLANFERRYIDKYNEKPTWWAAHGYDTVRLVVDCAVELGTADPSKIARRIHELSEYNATTGGITFRDDGAFVSDALAYSEIIGNRLVFKHLDNYEEGDVTAHE